MVTEGFGWYTFRPGVPIRTPILPASGATFHRFNPNSEFCAVTACSKDVQMIQAEYVPCYEYTVSIGTFNKSLLRLSVL